MSKPSTRPEISARQQIAAFKAHRTRLLKKLNEQPKPSAAVRKELKAQIAGYDALLADFAA
jgi:hypothetical protein